MLVSVSARAQLPYQEEAPVQQEETGRYELGGVDNGNHVSGVEPQAETNGAGESESDRQPASDYAIPEASD